MKTVLFIDSQQLNTSFEHVRQLFRELDAYGQVLACPWDSSAYSPNLVNSFLAERIGENDAWQAIVISDLSRENLADYAFDVWMQTNTADNRDPDLPLIPLQRLKAIVPYLDDDGRTTVSQLGLDQKGNYIPGRAMIEPMPSFSANPYDFVQNLHLTCYPSEIQHPVVKLGHLLLGLPAHVLDDGCVGLSASQGDKIRARVRMELVQAMAALAKAHAKRKERLAMADAADETAIPDDGTPDSLPMPPAQIEPETDDLDLDFDELNISALSLGELDLNNLLGDEFTLEELGLDGELDLSNIDFSEISSEYLGVTTVRKPFDLWMHEQVLKRAREMCPDTTIQDYSPAEIALKCPRPVSLAYVSFRDIPDNVPAKSLETENGSLGSLRSEFVVRNHFPDKARFIVVNRSRSGKEHRVREEMSFWSAVLLLCVNEIRNMGLKAYTMNQMTVGVDFEAYAEELSEKYGYALSARNLLEERLASIEASLNANGAFDRDMPVYQELVHVDFRVGKYSDLAIPIKRYGWLKDSEKPHSSGLRNLGYGIGRLPYRMRFSRAFDEHYFAEDCANIDASMSETLEEPRLAIAEAAADFGRIEPFDEDVLTGFKASPRQVAKLEKELTELENELAGTYSLSILNKGVYEKIMEIINARVTKRLSTRAFARQIVLVAIATLVACILAFSPYVFGFMGGEGFSRPAIAVSTACLLVVLIAGFIPLKISHREVKHMLGEVNGFIKGMLVQLKEKAHSLSVRMSDYASYRKGYSLYAHQKEERKPYTKESRELRRIRRDIDELTEGLSQDLEALGLWPVITTEDKFLSWGQAKAAIEDVDFFSISASPVFFDCPYNESRRSGMSVKSPFQFIEWLDIEDVRLFEPGYERGSNNVAF